MAFTKNELVLWSWGAFMWRSKIISIHFICKVIVFVLCFPKDNTLLMWINSKESLPFLGYKNPYMDLLSFLLTAIFSESKEKFQLSGNISNIYILSPLLIREYVSSSEFFTERQRTTENKGHLSQWKIWRYALNFETWMF